MSWPNDETWSAEKHEQIVTSESGRRFTWVVDCGHLTLRSGKLVACDPFAFLQRSDNPHVLVPPGRYPVSVTLADVSENLDGSDIREAYATIRITDGAEEGARYVLKVHPAWRDCSHLVVLFGACARLQLRKARATLQGVW